MPETAAGPGWPPARALCVRMKMFVVFDDRDELMARWP
jgi:hypothetical protein